MAADESRITVSDQWDWLSRRGSDAERSAARCREENKPQFVEAYAFEARMFFATAKSLLILIDHQEEWKAFMLAKRDAKAKAISRKRATA